MSEKIAVNKVSALRAFYHEGYNTKGLLLWADSLLEYKIPQPTVGYWHLEDVFAEIREDRKAMGLDITDDALFAELAK